MGYEIDFKGVRPPAAMAAEISAKVRHLERLFPRAVACEVVIRRRPARRPADYSAQIQLTVLRRELPDGALGG